MLFADTHSPLRGAGARTIARLRQAFIRARGGVILNRNKTGYDWFRIRNVNGGNLPEGTFTRGTCFEKLLPIFPIDGANSRSLPVPDRTNPTNGVASVLIPQANG